MKSKFLSVLIICVFILANIALVVQAANSSDLSDINKKIEETAGELSGIKKDKSATMNEVTALIAEISGYEDELELLSGEIDLKIEELEQKELELEKAEADCKKQDEDLKTRLVVLYEAGETSYIDVLLNSKSLTDFLSTFYLIEQLAEYDAELLEKLENARNEIEAAKIVVEEKKAELETAKESKERTTNSLKHSKATKDRRILELNADETETARKLQEFEEDKRMIVAELNAAGNSGGAGNIYPGGTLAWPVPASKYVSCEFRGYSGHNGMDIAASPGSSIVAINDGVVTTSRALKNSDGSYRSYGEYIIINHGGGVVSLYAHGLANSRMVSEGTRVSKGQSIMQVGSTGNSTGPHLHLEIMINGSYVNPRNQF